MTKSAKKKQEICLEIALMLKEKQNDYLELKELSDTEIGQMAKDLFLKTYKTMSEITV